MGRSYLDMSYAEREARKESCQYRSEAEKRTDEVKALRQTLVDIMEDLESFYEYDAQKLLLRRVMKNGHDGHLLNRLIRKM